MLFSQDLMEDTYRIMNTYNFTPKTLRKKFYITKIFRT